MRVCVREYNQKHTHTHTDTDREIHTDSVALGLQ